MAKRIRITIVIKNNLLLKKEWGLFSGKDCGGRFDGWGEVDCDEV
jgi:hypothetical protein